MAKQRKLTGDGTVDELMARFDYAFRIALDYFERMERIARAYGNKISTVNWPTISEISIPLTFMSVEEQLPFAMKYLFPDNQWIELIPTQAMPLEKVRPIEEDLRYTLMEEMHLYDGAHRSIKDCYKYAVGYGIIDTEWITPEQRMIYEMLMDGERIASEPQIVPGKPVQQCVYEYIPPVCVVPMPDGANVERPNKASGHFVLRVKSESELRDMYDKAEKAGSPMKGDVEKILKEARSLNFDSRMMPLEHLARLSIFDLAEINDADKRLPVVVPILCWYGDHHHAWIANGTTIIYEQKNTYQSMRSDLIKWSAWPDGDEWFPMGVTEASERLAWGVNVWYNGLIDLAMYHMNPSRVINTDVIDTSQGVGRGPRSDIEASGRADQAISYLNLPEFPQQLFVMGDALQSFHSQANAQHSTVRNGQAGLVRGGTNALETLLSTSTGRQMLASIALKTGGVKPTVEKTLIKRQLIADKQGRSFVQTQYNGDTGDREFNEINVTLDDLRHVFRVKLNMPASRLNSAAQFAERAGFFDRAMQNKALFDMPALYEFLSEDHDSIRRVMKPRSVVAEREERLAEASIMAEQQSAPNTQGDQALQGAAAISGEM